MKIPVNNCFDLVLSFNIAEILTSNWNNLQCLFQTNIYIYNHLNNLLSGPFFQKTIDVKLASIQSCIHLLVLKQSEV